ncbi:uncharacterized protein N7484_011525 [Penicillium longicatenatum]|uniref:uncharacterized protein n=1 Tax=Penicillium longicatenatum TaxID=1561947 RepID=UPI0025484C40|nr:uncharacterized protein N7484_011525 [Penicillium longicatenatum]KAJ5631425.1 hypothetical protein N7484_011525 [Penicillium longicatenatum]
MPPKKGTRKSMPARIVHTTFTPSRRSPRVPTPTRALNDNDYPTKTIDYSTDPSSENVVTFRYYHPKTPPQNIPLNNTSPDVTSTGRRPFQARPSRLSNVYTPVVETPNSSSQGSRRTRRTTARETPQNQLSDPDASESIGSTGWTYDQYMGSHDDTMAPPSPSAASSKGTRASARLRKPTSRAIEALALKKKPRKRATPASAKNETAESAAQAPNKTTPKSSKGKGKKTLKKNSTLWSIDCDIETAGRKLYEITMVALGADFELPSDPEWVIANARFEYFQAKEGLQRTREFSAGDENQPNLYDSETDTGSIRQYKQQSTPQIEDGGWARVGRINDHGEEIFFPPSDHSPYWPPRTYNDDTLPYPPVRSRSEKQTQNDNSFGFPPLMGDRNIPFDAHSHFVPEDVTEELARAQARGEARQKALPAPSEPRKPRSAKQRQTQPATADSPALGQETKPKRRATARASLPAPTTRKAAPPTKKPLARSAKAASKTAPAPLLADTDDGEGSSQDPPFRPIRLVLTAPRPEGKTNGHKEPGTDEDAVLPKIKKEGASPTSGKGKKRTADSMNGPAGETAAAKRARLAGTDESGPQKGRKRAATTTTTTPQKSAASKAKDQNEDSSRRKATPSRGRGRGRGGRGRGRGGS